MALSIGVGFLTAYPVNWWLVSKGLKHGLMTVRSNAQHAESPPGHDGRDVTETDQPRRAGAHAPSGHMHAEGV
jgi:hypothetical protein